MPQAGNDLSGELGSATLQPGETLAAVARKYDLGYFELIQANPEVSPKHLQAGALLMLPTQFILPNVRRSGIVINLSTMRLYYFPHDKRYYYTYPVGIGKQNWNSPVGQLKIIEKIKDPTWVVPESIYAFRKRQGDPVPRMMPPGPDNPLGAYALRLSNPTFLIHGTNDPESVGVRSSAGCIHLYPEDIKELFSMVRPGTEVTIISEPYEFGWQGQELYLNAHLPLIEQRKKLSEVAHATDLFAKNFQSTGVKINGTEAETAVNEHLGVPVKMGEIK